ncbi:MAG TPA: ribulokinase [Lacipirellulaceae bacterium]|jgi:L-ribulokinase|nr:ribulokinase [Lacipirellulaceae bacterium]
MAQPDKISLGIDFGTESVRALLVDLEGNERASAVVRYPHGQIVDTLPTDPHQKLPPDFALQHPQDWIDSAAQAVRAATDKSEAAVSDIIGIGVDFTSCTMLPTFADGRPLCMSDRFAKRPLAWPKLWKHHGAHAQTDRINAVAQSRNESFLTRYGGTIGLEWFFPKVLETIEGDSEAADASEVWLEAGDWFVWQLVGGAASDLPRSTCQAGYKAMWSAADGFPNAQFLKAVHPQLPAVVSQKMRGRFVAPGRRAGELTGAMANQFGLQPGTPISAAIIDAHAGVPGAGAAESGVLVMVLGTSSCHMLNADEERPVPGVAGVVQDGILPGYYGYETGQAAVGDAFDWLRIALGSDSHSALADQASSIAPGSDGVRALDWMNGCRTPLMNGSLSGAFAGLKIRHTGAHLYRALLEASAFGLRWIVDTMRGGGLPIHRFVATGGLPHHNPLIVQIYADVLGEPISVHPCQYGPALGAAILGTLAAGSEVSGFNTSAGAIEAMAGARLGDPKRQLRTFQPNQQHRQAYDVAYDDYRQLAEIFAKRVRV